MLKEVRATIEKSREALESNVTLYANISAFATAKISHAKAVYILGLTPQSETLNICQGNYQFSYYKSCSSYVESSRVMA